MTHSVYQIIVFQIIGRNTSCYLWDALLVPVPVDQFLPQTFLEVRRVLSRPSVTYHMTLIHWTCALYTEKSKIYDV